MNIRQTLLERHSRAQMLKIKAWVGDDQERFDELIKLVLGTEPLVAQRGSWAFSYCAEAHPDLMKPWMQKMLNFLDKPVHDAVKRAILRSWNFTDLPEAMHGEIADHCFRIIRNKSNAIAIRVYAIRVLNRICRIYPELWPELKLILEDGMHFELPAFTSTARQLFKQWKK